VSQPPILVIGAHRSGTSALARVLETLGVFVGARLDPNHEPWFFLRLNAWLLKQCGGRWDHPEAIDDLLRDADVRELVHDYLALTLRSPRTVSFFGLRRWLRTRSVDRIEGPWGFKDPRTTFTLPLWLEQFPDAKVLHIHRHGVDVAQSLVRRHRQHLERNRRGLDRQRALLRWLPKRAGFGDSARCATLDGAFELWERYMLRAREHVDALGERALTLRFEDLALRAPETVDRIVDFCELQPREAQRLLAAASMQRDRASAHQRDDELARFAERMQARIDVARGDAHSGRAATATTTTTTLGTTP